MNLRYRTRVEIGWKLSPKIILCSLASYPRRNEANLSLVFINKAAFYEMYFRSAGSSTVTESTKKQYVRIDLSPAFFMFQIPF